LYMLPCLLAEPVERQHRLIAHRFIESGRNFREQLEETVLAKEKAVVCATYRLCDQCCGSAFIMGFALETHGECLDMRLFFCCYCRDNRTVKPSRKEHPYRHIGNQAGLD